jgi:two-component system OmpR family sensor kinase
MLFVSYKTENLTQNSIKSLIKEKYIQVSKELFKYLADNDIDILNKKLKELKFDIILDKKNYLKLSKTVYRYQTQLSSIKILQYEDDRFFLYMQYLDDDILLIDISQSKNFREIKFLNILILADIVILILLFLIILKIIYPLKNISKSIKKFGDGEYSARVKIISNDEIAEVSNKFNDMASNIEQLIISRERLLRDIGHELKTPISKSKLALEMIDDSKYKSILQRALIQIDEMTTDLFNIEKLNSQYSQLKLEEFTVETLISLSLSKLFIEDESLIEIEIDYNFIIRADIDYLAIAVKNLIDNALKYTTKLPVKIEIKNRDISIKSRGNKLTKTLEFYCEVFTQGDNSREEKGYGLGLSMVKRILDKHNFKLIYTHKEEENIFIINFPYPLSL